MTTAVFCLLFFWTRRVSEVYVLDGRIFGLLRKFIYVLGNLFEGALLRFLWGRPDQSSVWRVHRSKEHACSWVSTLQAPLCYARAGGGGWLAEDGQASAGGEKRDSVLKGRGMASALA